MEWLEAVRACPPGGGVLLVWNRIFCLVEHGVVLASTSVASPLGRTLVSRVCWRETVKAQMLLPYKLTSSVNIPSTKVTTMEETVFSLA